MSAPRIGAGYLRPPKRLGTKEEVLAMLREHVMSGMKGVEETREQRMERKLTRPPRCECCGSECKPQAHHCDYGKPTDVMWLCKSCHVEWHKHNKPIYPDEAPITLPFPRHAIHAL